MKLIKKLLLTSTIAFSLSGMARDLNIKIEAYAVDKNAYPASEVTRDAIAALVKEGKAKFLTGAAMLTRSGQRASTSDVKDIIYPSNFTGIVLEFETRSIGNRFEVDPVLGADGLTLDLNFLVQHSTAAPEGQWRMTPVGNGLEVADPKFKVQMLSTQATLWVDGGWKLAGVMPELTTDDGAEPKNVYPVFVSATFSDP